jgi:ABC-type sulfate transport system permease component
MERIEALGVLAIGLGMMIGSFATMQGYELAVPASLLLILVGIGVILAYRFK